MTGRRKKGYDKSVYRSVTMVMQFGINMLVPICIMSAVGIYLDRRLGTSFWMIILFFVGAIAGGQNIYRMASRVYPSSQDDKVSPKGKKSKEPIQENENS